MEVRLRGQTFPPTPLLFPPFMRRRCLSSRRPHWPPLSQTGHPERRRASQIPRLCVSAVGMVRGRLRARRQETGAPGGRWVVRSPEPADFTLSKSSPRLCSPNLRVASWRFCLGPALLPQVGAGHEQDGGYGRRWPASGSCHRVTNSCPRARTSSSGYAPGDRTRVARSSGGTHGAVLVRCLGWSPETAPPLS